MLNTPNSAHWLKVLSGAASLMGASLFLSLPALADLEDSKTESLSSGAAAEVDVMETEAVESDVEDIAGDAAISESDVEVVVGTEAVDVGAEADLETSAEQPMVNESTEMDSLESELTPETEVELDAAEPTMPEAMPGMEAEAVDAEEDVTETDAISEETVEPADELSAEESSADDLTDAASPEAAAEEAEVEVEAGLETAPVDAEAATPDMEETSLETSDALPADNAIAEEISDTTMPEAMPESMPEAMPETMEPGTPAPMESEMETEVESGADALTEPAEESMGLQSSVEPQELQQFASAIPVLQNLEQSAREEVDAIITESGLTPQRFNELYRAQSEGTAPATEATDEEQASFEELVSQIESIESETLSQQDAAIRAEGLDPERFTEIMAMVQQNPTLQEQVILMMQPTAPEQPVAPEQPALEQPAPEQPTAE